MFEAYAPSAVGYFQLHACVVFRRADQWPSMMANRPGDLPADLYQSRPVLHRLRQRLMAVVHLSQQLSHVCEQLSALGQRPAGAACPRWRLRVCHEQAAGCRLFSDEVSDNRESQCARRK
eukprot:1588740-Pleurochrysis_carterae.AAC.2